MNKVTTYIMQDLFEDFRGYYKEYDVDGKKFILPVRIDSDNSVVESSPLFTDSNLDDLSPIIEARLVDSIYPALLKIDSYLMSILHLDRSKIKYDLNFHGFRTNYLDISFNDIKELIDQFIHKIGFEDFFVSLAIQTIPTSYKASTNWGEIEFNFFHLEVLDSEDQEIYRVPFTRFCSLWKPLNSAFTESDFDTIIREFRSENRTL